MIRRSFLGRAAAAALGLLGLAAVSSSPRLWPVHVFCRGRWVRVRMRELRKGEVFAACNADHLWLAHSDGDDAEGGQGGVVAIPLHGSTMEGVPA